MQTRKGKRPTQSGKRQAILLDGVSKTFLSHKRRGISRIILEGIGFSVKHKSTIQMEDVFWALKEVSLAIEHGEIVGVIGPNGAGKTTLLRLMAGLTQPSGGKLITHGQVSAMLGLLTGINPELSGRKNIIANGYLYGHRPKDVKARLDSIVDFADLGEFIDHPVRMYSSGMQARLSFSIVTGFGFNDILLIDEALGAGDARFAQKSWDRMRELIQQGRTVVIVSHLMGTIEALCERTIWLEAGQVKMDGDTKTVTAAYRKMVAEKVEQKTFEAIRSKKFQLNEEFGLENIELSDEQGQPRTRFLLREPLRIRIRYRSQKRMENVHMRLLLQRADGALILDSAQEQGQDMENTGVIEAFFEQILFSHGTYILVVQALAPWGEMLASDQVSLQVEDPLLYERGGMPIFFPPVAWKQVRTA
jgi:lipopolysaccharide transport system ATP-binding protein